MEHQPVQTLVRRPLFGADASAAHASATGRRIPPKQAGSLEPFAAAMSVGWLEIRAFATAPRCWDACRWASSLRSLDTFDEPKLTTATYLRFQGDLRLQKARSRGRGLVVAAYNHR